MQNYDIQMYFFVDFTISLDVLSSANSVGRLSPGDASWCSLTIIESITIDDINFFINNTFNKISYFNFFQKS